MLNFTLGPPTKRAGLAICTGERGFLIECTTASLCERRCGYADKRSIQTGAHVITFRPAGEEKREQSALRPPVCQILLASGRRAVKRTTRSSQLADGTRLKRAACMNLLRPFRAGAQAIIYAAYTQSTWRLLAADSRIASQITALRYPSTKSAPIGATAPSLTMQSNKWVISCTKVCSQPMI